MREETYKHLPLGEELLKIQGIVSPLTPCPLCMDHKRNYDFSLEKGLMFTWEELLPEIKEVMEAYFRTLDKTVEWSEMEPLRDIVYTGTKEETIPNYFN